MPTSRWLEHRMIVPQQQRYPRPLLLIHGAWHGAWCWEPAMHDFASRGFAVHAISLRGHGGSDPAPRFNLCGIDAYLHDIALALAIIKPTPIVIAHSLGGFLMQHYLERQRLPGLVLLCTMPHTGAGRFMWRWMWRHPRAALHSALTLNGRHLVGTPARAREAFFSAALTEEQVVAYTRQLGPEASLVAVESVVRRPRLQAGCTPILVVAGAADQVFTLDEQRAVAGAYHAAFVSIPAAAHDLMLDPAWPQAADVIEETVQLWMGREELVYQEAFEASSP